MKLMVASCFALGSLLFRPTGGNASVNERASTAGAVATGDKSTPNLESHGINVIRFENKRVFEDPEWVIDVIRGNFKK